ncbi:MAG: NAD-dependent epimerase/dehydratase [Pedobacter sp.]|jgi:nucleoside-diphosphate-sugar epimerase|nr:NAD-dependent epimerase/dehydratase [Pedobacter sp.]
MKKKVLITGASGFVGYHLIVEALEAGLDVFAAVRPSSDVSHLKNLDVTFTNLQYDSVDALKANITTNNYDYIIHASGTTKAKNKKEYNLINAEYSRNLAQAASETKIEKFVFVSSLAALGPSLNVGTNIEDDTTPNPVTSYGESKLLAEQYLRSIKNLPLLTFRPTAVYGPREKDIFILFKSINMGLEPYIGKFEQQFSFIYVKDLAAVLIASLQSDLVNKTYNVSDGVKYDRYALADYSKKVLNKKTFKFHLPVAAVGAIASLMEKMYASSSKTPALNKEKMAELTAINWACNINHLETDFAFLPKYNLESGLAETLLWYKNNKWLS